MSEFRQTLEVVINRKYGGFSLSIAAVKRMAELGHPKALEAVKLYSHEPWRMECHVLADLERHDLILLQVVRELGENANGDCASLKIVTVTFGYEISDYDGKESVHASGWLL